MFAFGPPRYSPAWMKERCKTLGANPRCWLDVNFLGPDASPTVQSREERARSRAAWTLARSPSHPLARGVATSHRWSDHRRPCRSIDPGVGREDSQHHRCATTNAAVLSVPAEFATQLSDVVRGKEMDGDLALLNAAMPAIVGRPGRIAGGIFRWSLDPTPGPEVGQWVPTHDQRVPPWLKPFNGDVLVAWDADGHYGAGVGRKMHDEFGHELSVGTEDALRGRGIGRALVQTAARLVLAQGKVPTYLHHPTNHASARLAEAAGFPDLGWRVLFFGPDPTN